MSTLALELDRCLKKLEPARAARLSAEVLRLVREAVPVEEEFDRQKQWRATVDAVAGSVPDFPDDFQEMPWETDREKID